MARVFLFCMLLLLTVSTAFASVPNTLRVALVNKQATAEISGDDEFVVTDRATGKTVKKPKGKYFLHTNNGVLSLEEGDSFSSEIAISAEEGKKLPKVNQRTYYGSYTVEAEDNTLMLVNKVQLDQYLACVLPAKTMNVWPDEVIKAQAVAARSYALYMAELNSGKDYDISANDRELTYLGNGKRIEKPTITKLVQATSGQYLTYNGKPVQAVTTSSSGGQTESAAAAWGREVPYLQALQDYDSDSPDSKWESTIAPVIVQGMLEQRGHKVGKLESLMLSPMDNPGTDRTASGRVRYIVFSGAEGTARIDADELAEMLHLNSTLFDVEAGIPVPDSLRVAIENAYGMEIGSKEIDINLKDTSTAWKNLVRSLHLLSGNKEEKLIFRGRGKGDGVGMSAWGARGYADLAEANNNYVKILQYYYPNTVLIK